MNMGPSKMSVTFPAKKTHFFFRFLLVGGHERLLPFNLYTFPMAHIGSDRNLFILSNVSLSQAMLWKQLCCIALPRTDRSPGEKGISNRGPP